MGIRSILFVASLAVAVSFMGFEQVSAFGNTFPDLADTEAGANIYAVNTRNDYVQQSNSMISVWFPTSGGGTITIHNGHFCNSNPHDYTYSGWPANGTNITRFNARSAGATIASGDGTPSGNETLFGMKRGTVGLCDNTISFNVSNIPASQVQNGYYEVELDIDHVGPWGTVNYFRITATGANTRIGLRGGSTGHATTQEQVDTSPAYTTYSVPFGTPCGIGTNQNPSITFYDIDNAGGSGAQPTSGPPVSARIWNITTGNWVDWDGATGITWTPPDTQNNTQSKGFTARPGHKYRLEIRDVFWNNTIQYSVPYAQIFRLNCSWSLDGWATIENQTGTINSRRDRDRMFRFGIDRSGGSAPNIHIVERWMSGNSGTQFNNAGNLYDFGGNWSDNYNFHVPANATPGTNYCMRVEYEPRSSTNDNWGNSNTVCVRVIEANVRAIVNHTPPETSYVEIGNTVTSNARISNTGTSPGNLQYNYQIWYEVDGLTGAADRAFNPGDQQRQMVDWTNITANIGQTPINPPYTRAVTNPPANASHVCSRLEIRRQTGDTSIINPASNAVDVECTPIGKAPSFAATAGNVRTGGNYGSGTCSVWKPSAINTDDRLAHYFGIIAHNYSNISATPHHTYFRDAAVSLGYIDNVVTKQSGIGDGTNIELHFARGAGAPNPATARGGGLFYGSSGSSPSAGIFPLANPVDTHCLTNLFEANRYPAAATPNNVSVNDTEALPAPVAGSNAVTYNICGNVANNQLVLTGPGGGELVLQPGQQYVVRVTQNGPGCNTFPVFVRINSNIRYTGTNAPIDQLPQFVFLAGTDGNSRVGIHVDNAVTRLDGIYANRGTSDDSATFLTCAQRATPGNLAVLRNITIGDCSNPLTVNGAVVLGGRLDLFRAAGHGNITDNNPAEFFNLRPDTILSDYARDRSSAQLEIIYQRELAPRF